MDKINVEAIWKKYYMNHYDERDNIMARKAAIKEIVEAVIDKCADSNIISNDWFLDDEGKWFSEKTILNIKKEIEYD